MKKLIIIPLLILLSGCACISTDTAFGLDGKAVSWCERKQRAEKLCKKHDGLEDYYFGWAKCKDGEKFGEDKMEPR